MSNTTLARRVPRALSVGPAVVTAPEHMARASLLLRGCKSVRVPTSVGRVHVLDAAGQGALPETVLLHGFSAAAAHYHQLLVALRPHVRRVVAPDMPAHGLSDTPRDGVRGATLQTGLFEALDAVSPRDAVVFGNSMGGLAAIKYALRRPERVRALVLVSPGGAAMSPAEIEDFLQIFRVQTHEEALRFTDRLFPLPSVARHAIAWGVRHKFGHENMRALLRSLRPEDLLSPHELARLEMPVLLLWGRSDRVLPEAHFEFFRRHLPGHAVLERPRSYSHSPFLDQGPDLARRVLAWLDDVHHGRVPTREAAPRAQGASAAPPSALVSHAA